MREAIGMGVEEEDRKRMWMEDADSLVARGFVLYICIYIYIDKEVSPI